MDGGGIDTMSNHTKHQKAIKKIETAFQAGKYAEALDLCNVAIALNPKDIVAYRAKARLLQIQRDFAGAEKYYDAAEKRGELTADDLVNRGIVKAEQQKYDEGIKDFDRALKLKPDYLLAYIQRGASQWEMRRWPEALESFREANKIDPTHANAQWILGLLLLQQGEFKEGWPLYDTRWRSDRFKSRPLLTQKPQWNPSSEAKSVLVWGEQGIGDQVIYGSLLTALKQRVEKVTAMVDPRLISIFSRSMPDIEFMSHIDKIRSDAYDAHIPFASLGSCFVESVDDIAKYAARKYLKPDPARVKAICDEAGFTGNDKVIGVSWVSSAIKIGPHKSVNLEQLLPILRLPGYKFLNLQYGSSKAAVEKFNEAYGTNIVTTSVDLLKDIEGLAAACAACDLLVAISSSTVHIAGAIGTPVKLMDANKLWYWGNKDGDHSLWYPSVKIYPRDNMIAPWDNVIEKVRSEL